jgi:hypothetical protein
MPTKVRLTRLDSNHQNLRTPTVEGLLHSALEVGEEIWITAEPLDKSLDVRAIRTTPIERIDGDIYHTANSIYRIELLGKEIAT